MSSPYDAKRPLEYWRIALDEYRANAWRAKVFAAIANDTRYARYNTGDDIEPDEADFYPQEAEERDYAHIDWGKSSLVTAQAPAQAPAPALTPQTYSTPAPRHPSFYPNHAQLAGRKPDDILPTQSEIDEYARTGVFPASWEKRAADFQGGHEVWWALAEISRLLRGATTGAMPPAGRPENCYWCGNQRMSNVACPHCGRP
jgi:hypothetical protein